MKKLYVLLFLVLCLALASPINAQVITPDDVFPSMISYTQEISRGTVIFQLKNPLLTPVTIDNTKLGYEIVKKLGSSDTTSVNYFYEAQANNTYEIKDCRWFAREVDKNGSAIYSLECTAKNVTETFNVWIPFTSLTVGARQAVTFKVEVDFQAKLGENARDWIPTLNIAGIKYRQVKWAWFNSSFKNRIDINLTQFRANESIEVNLTALNISCSNVNCTDVVIVDQNDAELRGENNNKMWQVPLDNISSKNKPRNDFVVFIPQNNSLHYYLYYNNTAVNNTGGSILLWQDNFERYAIGATPDKATLSISTQGAVCSTNGQKAVGCNVTGGQYISWNITQYRNITVQWEINNSASNVNDLILDMFGDGGTSSYRWPQINPSDTYGINFNGGATLGTTIAFTGTEARGYNITSQRDGNAINLFINHTVKGGNTTDTTRVTDSRIGYRPSVTFKALLSLSAYNLTVQTFTNQTTFTISAPQQESSLIINNPQNITYNTQQQLNVTVQLANLDKCYYALDNTANLSFGNCSTTTQINATSGTHKLEVFANSTTTSTISAIVYFTYDFNAVVIYAFDETNATAIQNFTAQIANSTFSQTGTANNFNVTFLTIGSGQYTITVGATDFGTRSYLFTKASNDANVLNAYLPRITSSTHSVAIRTSTLSGSPLSGIRIDVSKLINLNYQNISSAVTDDTGSASFFLDAQITYRITIQFPSGTRTFSLQPVADVYTFFETGLTGTFSSIFQDITWQIAPQNSVLSKNTSQKINLTIYSYQRTLTPNSQIIAVYQGNTYQINATISPSNFSANATLTLDLSNAISGQTVQASFYVNSTNPNIGYVLLETRTYQIFTQASYPNLTLEFVLADTARQSGLDLNGLGILALFFTVIVTGLIHSRLHPNPFVTLIAFVGILGIFTFTGWFDFYLWAIVAIIAGLYYYYNAGVS